MGVNIRNRVKELRRVKASTLIPNEANWRKHPQYQQEALKGVLQEVGFADALLVRELPDGKYQIIDGHLRAETVGDMEVPVLVLDLNDDETGKLLATLDPLAAMAQADNDKLVELLSSVKFEDAAVNAMLEALANGETAPMPPLHEVTDPGADIDRAAELQVKWQTERGQVWEIPSLNCKGKAHRLMCGDSTEPNDLSLLMAQTKAALFATDPPYGIDYDSAGLHRNETHYDAIQQDDLKDDKYQAWLEMVFLAWSPFLRENAAWYLWHPMLTQGYFAAAAAAAAEVIISRQIIWVKPQFIFGRGEYHWMHELCFYGWRQGHRPPFFGEHNQTTVWSMGYDGNRNNRDHPTQKPVGLWLTPMQNHTKQGEVCAEPFSGSGTQLVAAEQLGRVCYGMEIEPKYVAVALERIAKMGLEPRLATSLQQEAYSGSAQA